VIVSAAVSGPEAIHGVWVNGQQIDDGSDYLPLASDPGQLLTKFLHSSRSTEMPARFAERVVTSW
jgi:hypothetical protein